MLQNELGPIFPLGKVTLSRGAEKSLLKKDVMDALSRHLQGDCGGDASDVDQFKFAFALEDCRVVGAYRTRNGRKFLIVTEADRSRTTVMLPEEL